MPQIAVRRAQRATKKRSVVGNVIDEYDGRRGRVDRLADGMRRSRSRPRSLPTPPGQRRGKPRFGRNELVDRGTAQRTMSRVRRLREMGAKVPGGKYGTGIFKGGITGGEAQRARTVLARARDMNQQVIRSDRPVRRATPVSTAPNPAVARTTAQQTTLKKAEVASRSRGIGQQVRVLAHDKSRTGGIGSQVRQLAQQRRIVDMKLQRRKRAKRVAY